MFALGRAYLGSQCSKIPNCRSDEMECQILSMSKKKYFKYVKPCQYMNKNSKSTENLESSENYASIFVTPWYLALHFLLFLQH